MRRNLGDAGAAIESPGVASRRGFGAGLLKSNRAEDFYHDPNDQLRLNLHYVRTTFCQPKGLWAAFSGAIADFQSDLDCNEVR
jgi:hypothetical protein